MIQKKLILILWNVRSVQNTASLFRTADAAGVEKILLAGITPKPVNRFGKPDPRFVKVSLGAERMVPWEHVRAERKTLDALRKAGYAIYATEQSPRAIPYFRVRRTTRVALILGNEITGVPRSVMHYVDAVLEIPMRGKKESLNVAIAGGIMLFRLQYK